LQIGIHGENDVASGRLESRVQGGGFAEISPERNKPDILIFSGNLANHIEGIVPGPVVHEKDFVRIWPHVAPDAFRQLAQGIRFIEDGYYERDEHEPPEFISSTGQSAQPEEEA
jgi:3',5'-cyclic AMP phosphodiesterase CpdA